MEDRFFPLFVDVKNRDILIIGAGKIAYRKACTLSEYGACITVITKEVSEPQFLNLKNIHIETREFSQDDLKGRFLVVAATDDEKFNLYISDLCSKKNILVNNITSKSHMNCRFASIVETPQYQIGISAKGNPAKSKALKGKLKEYLEHLED